MTTAELFALNEQFGIHGELIFREGRGGLAVVEIANSHAVATVALQGAQLLGWIPRGEQPVIWLSRDARFEVGRSMRGGVPVCWPWFGPHTTQSSFPAHGFARTVPWQVCETKTLEDGATFITFRVVQSDATAVFWPHTSALELAIKVGATLDLDLVTRNTGAESITIGDALHTYFVVKDVRHIAVEGLDGCPYIDKLDSDKRKQQSGPVTFNAETDRIYLDASADCLINDPGMQRRIRIGKSGSRSTVVWNPWSDKAERMGDMGENGYLNMVCVESTNAADDMVTIAPGDEHHLWVSYQVELLATN
jgi:D-hexose-6-phosphate mutarotase